MEKFQVYPQTGFIPNVPPLSRLPEYFTAWEDLLDDLHRLLNAKRLREEVDNNLPLLVVSDGDLPTERHWMRARKILTFLSQGYLWQEGREGAVSVLPKQLAIPWWEVSNRLGLPPVVTYSELVLWNWRLKDTDGPISSDNILLESTFTGTENERGFFTVSVVLELVAASGINGAVECLREAENGHVSKVIEWLETVRISIHKVAEALETMYTNCDPEFFFHNLTPFLTGSEDFKDGLIYEGVSPEPKRYQKASAAQSSVISVFDIFLGIEHKGGVEEFIYTEKWHMPGPHRQFLMMLSQQPKLREFVLVNKSNTELCNAYNRCVQALVDFRNKHIIMVSRYIVTPLSKIMEAKGGAKEEGGGAKEDGGGAPFVVLLKKSRDETVKCLVE